jgi:hypothetical protein
MQDSCAYAAVTYSSLFLSLVLNYLYSTFLQEVMTDICESIIKMFDFLQIEVHFMRYLYLAIFETRQQEISTNMKIDCLILFLVIFPCFIIALRFWTAPVYLNFRSKLNAYSVMVSFPLLFFAFHTDIILLLMLVTWMNVYALWYHCDPPSNIY